METVKKKLKRLEERMATIEEESKAQWKAQGELALQKIDAAIEDAIASLTHVVEHREALTFTVPEYDRVRQILEREFALRGLGDPYNRVIRQLLPDDLGLVSWGDNPEGDLCNCRLRDTQVVLIVGLWVPHNADFTTREVHFHHGANRVWIVSLDELHSLPSSSARIQWMAPLGGGAVLFGPDDSIRIMKIGSTGDYVGLIGFVAERRGVTVSW